MVILYAFAEGTFANWSVIFLHEERGIAPAQAALALSVFWAMMAVGRLLVSALLLRIPAARIWLTLPVLMISAFLLLPLAHSALTGIALFAFAGLACSAFFPVSVGLITRRFPASAALVSSLMIAALMLGVGSGSFAIGALRAMLSLENLYRVSTLYPLTAFVLAVMLLKSGAIPSRQ
jgi:predicted MFS family arabinose efflux permease